MQLSSMSLALTRAGLRATLGPELVTAQADREFSSDTGWWTKAGVTISGGVVNYVGVASQTAGVYRSLAVNGTQYEVAFDIVTITQGGIAVYAGGNRSATATVVGRHTFRVTAAAVDALLLFENQGLTTATIDNVSIKVVLS